MNDALTDPSFSFWWSLSGESTLAWTICKFVHKIDGVLLYKTSTTKWTIVCYCDRPKATRWVWVVTFRPMFNSDLSVPPPPIPAELSLSWLSERLSQITKWRRVTFILTIFVKISQIRLWSLSFVEVIKFLNLFLLSFVFSICRVTVWSTEPELRLSIEMIMAQFVLNFLSEWIWIQIKYTLYV